MIFSGKWFLNTIATVIVTMIFIYFIKKISQKYEVPVLKQVSEGI